MGTWLIFQGLLDVTNSVCCLGLLDYRGFEGVPGNNASV
jgi:hypothetical protein